jgi:hypothetical protein
MAELKKYVLGVMEDCAEICAEEMLEIMREEIENAYNNYSPVQYVRTGELLNTPQVISVSSDGIVTEFVDNGNWFSLVGKTKGQHFFALEGLEGGYSWGRGATSIYSTSVDRCNNRIPDYYARCLRAFGIPIA